MSRTPTVGPRPPRLPTPATVDAELEARLQRAWATLIPSADAIADSITSLLEHNDPVWFERADPALKADVVHNTREHVRRGLRTLAHQDDPEHRPADVWRETGRRRARQGISMEVVLTAYTLGTRVMWEALLQLDRDVLGLDDHLLLIAGQRLWHALDVQNAVLIDAHRRESARLTRRDLQRQQSLLDRLVDGSAEPELADEAATALGIAAGEPVACVVAPFDSLEEPLRSPEDRLERAGRMSFWHVRGGAQFGLVPIEGSSGDDLAELLGPAAAGRVGIALSAEGVSGFAAAFQLASRAAATLPRGKVEVVQVVDRLPELLLSASPEVATLLAEETVAPLLGLGRHQSEVLLATLATLVRCNGSPTKAAEELYCHRNTVLYRLKQIESLTRRDLRDPRDRLLLALGLLAVGHAEGGR